MYPQEIFVGCIEGLAGTAFTTSQNITAAANVWGAGAIVHFPMMVERATFRITTATLDITSSVIALQKVTVGNVTSEMTTLTVPNGTAVGKVLIKDFSPVKLGIGDKLQFKLKTQGGLGGTPAGAGVTGFFGSLQPEVPGNETNAIVSV